MPPIFKWSCSYYRNKTKKWIYGNLYMYQETLKFIETNKNEEPLKVLIQLSSISEIKRVTSMIMYSCMVLNMGVGLPLWFSSFENRNRVIQTVEHFWREQLLGKSDTESSITRPENDLLRLVYDTQSTLMGAAHALHSQGQQLSNASRIMNNLNVDLAVADRITKDLESYFGAWRCKKQFEKPKVKIEERHGSPLDNDRIEYKVLIGKFVQNTHTDGYLIIGKNAVELLDEKSKILYAFKAGQISNLNVHSPWDVTLIQSYIGRPDVKVHLISTQMPVILRLLENFTRCKANLDDVPEGTAFVDEITSFDEVDGKEISENDKHRENAVNLCPQSSSLRQKQKKQSALSEEETGEISTVLRSMKKLATDIAAEQDLQLQQIDVLNKSVERANSQIKQTDSKVKKMT